MTSIKLSTCVIAVAAMAAAAAPSLSQARTYYYHHHHRHYVSQGRSCSEQRRAHGTRGIVLGGLSGGTVGAAVSHGSVAGALIGGTAGAVIGNSAGRKDVDARCR